MGDNEECLKPKVKKEKTKQEQNKHGPFKNCNSKKMLF